MLVLIALVFLCVLIRLRPLSVMCFHRRYNRRALAIILASALAAACGHRGPPLVVPEPTLPERGEPRELAVDQQAKHALSRLTYGARPGEAALVVHEGLDHWLARQLTPENWPDAAADSVLALYPAATMSIRMLIDSSPSQFTFLQRRRAELGLAVNAKYVMTADDSARFKAMTALGARRAQQYLAAKLARAVASDHQLQEVMTDFWENHFSVYRGKMPSQFTLLEYDRDVIRPHALGKFRDLLGAVAHSAAMLYYLDNQQSGADSGRTTLDQLRILAAQKNAADTARIRAAILRRHGALNENYGRELMELHTLGVDGGYTQDDVINVARAFSGWAAITGREGGDFYFTPSNHDAEPKLVLGHLLPGGRGKEDGEEVLDILARHPNTAHYIAMKLVRHFVSDNPPASLVDRAARTFTQTDGDIRQVLAVIVSSPEFYSRAAVRAKVKTPYELVASTYRVLGGQPDTLGRSLQYVATLGQQLYGHLTPDGWPDVADAWMNTGAMLLRINFGSDVAAGRVIGIVPAKMPLAFTLSAANREEQVDAVTGAVLQGELSPDTRQVLMAGENPLAGAPANRRLPTFIELLGLALGAPEFQRH